ncbi:MAG: neutral zinc metallopeptidase [Leptolyngbyaceae cyanobacterium CAN_BIN12]|nr:neutral zinc metallopeptidase [Leptolyngbyaceae cyanobacterium CAN_BIN12]
MKWQMGRQSDNVEDQRGGGVGKAVAGGGIGTIILAIVVTLLGGDPSIVLDQAANNPPASNAPQGNKAPAPTQETKFVAAVLAQTEDVWNEQFQALGRTYQEPKLVIFSGAVQSACGVAQSSTGPFYCPSDRKVYLDTSFFRDMKTQLQSPGDFAQAYVIAHEVGHHVQNQLGILPKVNQLQRQVSKTEANQLSVRVELQADCFAGVWANQANQTKQILEPGDIEEALNAASQIGDDRLQSQARGYVVPDSFTHGSSAQRVRWFKRGVQSGSLKQCDTFSASKI